MNNKDKSVQSYTERKGINLTSINEIPRGWITKTTTEPTFNLQQTETPKCRLSHQKKL